MIFSKIPPKLIIIFNSCFDPTYCPQDPPVPLELNAFYEVPPRGTLKYEDGETVRYTCENTIYRFPNKDVPKDEWVDTFDVVCGWENQWDPPVVPGCVDPRGCQEPPLRTDRIWGSYEDTYGSLEVGSLYWYECRKGVFEMQDGTQKQSIDLICINDPNGGPPYFYPPYEHDTNPFPPCVILRKYKSEVF